ncbi:MAG: hypothetical protein ACK554_04585 [Erythrobacteraceae bacterium]
MKTLTDYLRTTIIGGLLFLFPIVLVLIPLSKVTAPVRKLAESIALRIGVENFAGLAIGTLLEIFIFLAGAFVVGLLAHTAPAQAFLRWLRAGIAAVLPKFSLMEELAQSFDKDAASTPVVLAPSDAGWILGIMVE